MAAFRQAAAATSADHPSLAGRLSDLGASLLTRFERTGDPADLDAAINAARQAVDVTPPGHTDLPGRLSNFGNALIRRFERTGDTTDLDAAIDAGRRAVSATPAEYHALATVLANLGNALRSRFDHLGNTADLDEAIEAGRQAVAAAPPGHPGLATMQSNLGNALRARFEHGADAADLDAAIDAGRQAVADAPVNHPYRPGFLSNLGIALRHRFEHAGNSADLDAAIDAARQAVDATPSGHPRLAERLSNLGAALRTRYDHTGNGADLDAAIDAGRQAADAAPAIHPGRPVYLTNLATILASRFGRTGDAADLDEAIGFARQAVDATSAAHPQRARMLSNLGTFLRARFDIAGDAADLEAATDAGRKAVNATPAGATTFAGHLSNLGNTLQARFEHAGNPADLDAAIDAARQAVDATPPGHPQRARLLANLATASARRFSDAGDPADLDTAIDTGRQAVAATSPDHPSLATMLSNLGNFLRTRFGQSGEPADLDAAIGNAQQAVAATAPGDPSLPGHLANLGNSIWTRFEHAGEPADLNSAITHWQQAAGTPTGIPKMRLAAARSWGFAAARAGLTKTAAEGYEAAVRLLPEVAWHGLDRATREQQIAQWAGLAADAAACMILDGYPERAVELLEQGRSVLWTHALNLRTDLTRLAENAPHLAERLDAIRKILDTPLLDAMDDDTSFARRDRQQHDLADLRRRNAREWDTVLAQVRALEGFEHFLDTIPYGELAAAATGGPVVMINASTFGCHALIVDAGNPQPHVVSLPALTLDAAVERVGLLLAALAGTGQANRAFRDREKDRHAILDILEWLWDVIAEPVLTALGHLSIPEADALRPQVWWCPVGVLSLLPIHAAGHHPRLRTAKQGDSVPDRLISSYTPTLSMLARSREEQALPPVGQLTIGMPTTPGLPPLPAVPDELKVLARFFPRDTSRELIGTQATRAAVLTAIATRTWTHFACHASQQHADPDRSGFALWDGTLTITDLAAQPTQRRDLAFLSACHTATGSIHHVDEAIHVAAAMQFLGYRHVIATLWTIADSPAPYIADLFYTAVTSGEEPDPERAADALHHAVASLRQSDPTDPLLWGPYVHFGPLRHYAWTWTEGAPFAHDHLEPQQDHIAHP